VRLVARLSARGDSKQNTALIWCSFYLIRVNKKCTDNIKLIAALCFDTMTTNDDLEDRDDVVKHTYTSVVENGQKTVEIFLDAQGAA